MNEGDLVLAKIKGFPDWPAVVVPVDNIPVKLQTPKYSKFIDNYLKKGCDQVCVKFFYDDQYSWTKLSNVKPLERHVIEDHILTANESKRGGRVKRITEAYLKARDVPIDEFLEFGSFGKPPTPEPEEEEEIEELDEEIVTPPLESKKRGRKSGVVKSKTKAKAKPKGKGKGKTKGKKVNTETSSEEPFEDDDEILEFMDNDDDEDFEGPDLSDEVDVEEEEEEEEAEEEDDDEDDNSTTSKKRKVVPIEVPSPFLSKQPPDFNVNFKDIPSATALANEVTEMTRWCSSLRSELQAAVIDYNTKQSTIDDLITPLISADLSKSILKSTKLSQVVHILLSIPERQSPTTKKLAKWWSANFNFNVKPDIHWSPTFTEEMHLEEEAARRAHVAFLRQKRKEERKQSETPVPSSA